LIAVVHRGETIKGETLRPGRDERVADRAGSGLEAANLVLGMVEIAVGADEGDAVAFVIDGEAEDGAAHLLFAEEASAPFEIVSVDAFDAVAGLDGELPLRSGGGDEKIGRAGLSHERPVRIRAVQANHFDDLVAVDVDHRDASGDITALVL